MGHIVLVGFISATFQELDRNSVIKLKLACKNGDILGTLPQYLNKLAIFWWYLRKNCNALFYGLEKRKI
jgi:hypothetical protein